MVQDPPTSRPSPLSIELEFRTLLVRLSYPLSAPRHLLELDSFLDKILPECVLYESYILEVVQRIPDIVERLNVSGIDPATLRPLYEKLKELVVRLPSVSGVQDLAKAMQRLRTGLSLLYHFVGETNQGVEFDPGAPARRNLDSSEGGSEGILIPVVERSLVEVHGSLKESGNLRRISIQITGTAKDPADVFHTQVLVLGEGGRLSNVLTVPAAAARALLIQGSPEFRQKYFTGFVTFDELNSFHQGSSANLAIASLIYYALLKYVGAREQYVLTNTMTATGDINERGDILPVDADSLKLKAEAVFFSGLQYFVVPKSQLAIVQDVIRSLRTRYPNRELTVIGLNRLEEIFYDRRLTHQKQMNVVEQFVRKTWKNRVQLLGATTVIALLLVLARALGPSQDNNPVSAGIAVNMLQIKNSKGEILDEIVVDPQTLRRAEFIGSYDPSRICKFYDIDRDGKNEFLYLQEGKRDTGYKSALICRSPWRKLPRWSASFHENYSFPSNPVNTDEDLAITDFLVDDFEGRGSPVVMVTAGRIEYPSLIYELDAQTSAQKAQYLNVGHIYLMAAHDIDGNGRKELLIAGMNNAFNTTFLAVFDPRLIKGHSPWKSPYTTDGIEPGTEMYYVLIPRTVLGEAARHQSYNNRPVAFDIGSRSRDFSLTVADFVMVDGHGANPQMATIRLTFNDSLRTFVSSGSAYDHFRDLMFSQRKVRRLVDPAYLNGEFSGSLMFWDGTHWKHQPTMNNRYLDALKTIELQKTATGMPQ